ncbi:MAG TPA: hypothetical protein VK597_10040 [Inquilinus sp.]|nr:hypothetical protein [Inquilinus sp.]
MDALPQDPVAAYKAILKEVLDNRPSGTRSRLAAALGKNRSFVTQITGPAYPVPIPASHIDVILDICHFPPEARRRFLEAYARAHPHRLKSGREHRRVRAHTIYLPDLGSDRKNRELEALVDDLAHGVARLIEDS